MSVNVQFCCDLEEENLFIRNIRQQVKFCQFESKKRFGRHHFVHTVCGPADTEPEFLNTLK
jgi:hypothetical protein